MGKEVLTSPSCGPAMTPFCPCQAHLGAFSSGNFLPKVSARQNWAGRQADISLGQHQGNSPRVGNTDVTAGVQGRLKFSPPTQGVLETSNG